MPFLNIFQLALISTKIVTYFSRLKDGSDGLSTSHAPIWIKQADNLANNIQQHKQLGYSRFFLLHPDHDVSVLIPEQKQIIRNL